MYDEEFRNTATRKDGASPVSRKILNFPGSDVIGLVDDGYQKYDGKERHATLRIHQIQCVDLKSRGKCLFVVFNFGDNFDYKTETRTQGGTTMLWDLNVTHTFSAFQLREVVFDVQVIDENKTFANTSVGSSTARLETLCAAKFGEDIVFDVPLKDKKDKVAGMVKFFVSWEDGPITAKETHRLNSTLHELEALNKKFLADLMKNLEALQLSNTAFKTYQIEDNVKTSSPLLLSPLQHFHMDDAKLSKGGPGSCMESSMTHTHHVDAPLEFSIDSLQMTVADAVKWREWPGKWRDDTAPTDTDLLEELQVEFQHVFEMLCSLDMEKKMLVDRLDSLNKAAAQAPPLRHSLLAAQRSLEAEKLEKSQAIAAMEAKIDELNARLDTLQESHRKEVLAAEVRVAVAEARLGEGEKAWAAERVANTALTSRIQEAERRLAVVLDENTKLLQVSEARWTEMGDVERKVQDLQNISNIRDVEMAAERKEYDAKLAMLEAQLDDMRACNVSQEVLRAEEKAQVQGQLAEAGALVRCWQLGIDALQIQDMGSNTLAESQLLLLREGLRSMESQLLTLNSDQPLDQRSEGRGSSPKPSHSLGNAAQVMEGWKDERIAALKIELAEAHRQLSSVKQDSVSLRPQAGQDQLGGGGEVGKGCSDAHVLSEDIEAANRALKTTVASLERALQGSEMSRERLEQEVVALTMQAAECDSLESCIDGDSFDSNMEKLFIAMQHTIVLKPPTFEPPEQPPGTFGDRLVVMEKELSDSIDTIARLKLQNTELLQSVAQLSHSHSRSHFSGDSLLRDSSRSTDTKLEDVLGEMAALQTSSRSQIGSLRADLALAHEEAVAAHRARKECEDLWQREIDSHAKEISALRIDLNFFAQQNQYLQAQWLEAKRSTSAMEAELRNSMVKFEGKARETASANEKTTTLLETALQEAKSQISSLMSENQNLEYFAKQCEREAAEGFRRKAHMTASLQHEVLIARHELHSLEAAHADVLKALGTKLGEAVNKLGTLADKPKTSGHNEKTNLQNGKKVLNSKLLQVQSNLMNFLSSFSAFKVADEVREEGIAVEAIENEGHSLVFLEKQKVDLEMALNALKIEQSAAHEESQEELASMKSLRGAPSVGNFAVVAHDEGERGHYLQVQLQETERTLAGMTDFERLKNSSVDELKSTEKHGADASSATLQNHSLDHQVHSLDDQILPLESNVSEALERSLKLGVSANTHRFEAIMEEVLSFMQQILTSADEEALQLQQQLTIAEGDVHELTHRIATADDELADLRLRVTSADEESLQLRQRVTAAEAEAHELRQLVSTAEDEARQLHQRVAMAEEEAAQLRLQLTTAEAETRRLTQQVAAGQDEAHQLRHRLSTSEAEGRQLSQRAATAEDEARQLCERVTMASEESSRLRLQLTAAEAQAQQFRQQLTSIGDEAHELRQRLCTVEDPIHHQVPELADLHHQVPELADLHLCLISADQESLQLRQRVTAAEAEAHELRQRITAVEDGARQLHQRVAMAEEETAQLRLQLTTAEAETRRLTQQVAAGQDEAHQLRHRLSTSEAEVFQLRQQFKTVDDEAYELRRRIRASEDKALQLSQRATVAEEEVSRLRARGITDNSEALHTHTIGERQSHLQDETAAAGDAVQLSRAVGSEQVRKSDEESSLVAKIVGLEAHLAESDEGQSNVSIDQILLKDHGTVGVTQAHNETLKQQLLEAEERERGLRMAESQTSILIRNLEAMNADANTKISFLEERVKESANGKPIQIDSRSNQLQQLPLINQVETDEWPLLLASKDETIDTLKLQCSTLESDLMAARRDLGEKSLIIYSTERKAEAQTSDKSTATDVSCDDDVDVGAAMENEISLLKQVLNDSAMEVSSLNIAQQEFQERILFLESKLEETVTALSAMHDLLASSETRHRSALATSQAQIEKLKCEFDVKEADLKRRKDELEAKRSELESQKINLDGRLLALQKQVTRMVERSSEIEEREVTLDQREARLLKQIADLDQRRIGFDKLKAAMDEAAFESGKQRAASDERKNASLDAAEAYFNIQMIDVTERRKALDARQAAEDDERLQWDAQKRDLHAAAEVWEEMRAVLEAGCAEIERAAMSRSQPGVGPHMSDMEKSTILHEVKPVEGGAILLSDERQPDSASNVGGHEGSLGGDGLKAAIQGAVVAMRKHKCLLGERQAAVDAGEARLGEARAAVQLQRDALEVWKEKSGLLELEVDRSRANISALESENDRMKKEISHFEKALSESESETKVLHEKITLHIDELELASQRAKLMADENEKIANVNRSERDRITADLEAAAAKIVSLQDQLNRKELEKNASIAGLTSQMNTLLSDLENLKSSSAEHTNFMNACHAQEMKDAENNAAKKEEVFSDMIAQTLNKLSLAEAVKRRLVGDIEASAAALAKAEVQLVDVNQQLGALEEQRVAAAASFSEEVGAVAAELDDVKRDSRVRIASLEAQLAIATRSTDDKDVLVSNFVAKNIKLEESVAALQAQLDSSSGRLAQLSDENKRLNEALTTTEGQLSTYKDRLVSIEIDREKTTKAMSSTIQSLTQELNVTREASARDVVRLRTALTETQRRLASTENKYRTVSQEMEFLSSRTLDLLSYNEARRDEAQAKLQIVQSSSSEEISQLRAEFDRVRAQVATLLFDNSRLEGEVTTLSQSLTEVQQSLSNAQKALKTAEEANSSLEKETMDLTSELAVVKAAGEDRIESLEAKLAQALNHVSLSKLRQLLRLWEGLDG